MRIGGKRMTTGRLPLLYFFLAGVLLGTILMNAGKSMLLEDTGLLDEYALYHMKYMTVDSNALFWYVMGKRLKTVVFMAVLATTYLGLAAVCAMAACCGATLGMFLSAVVIRYGLKGVLLALTGVFPQYLLYVPAIILLMIWCERVCRGIYFRGAADTDSGQRPMGRLLQLLVIFLVVITGCMLESYVNPVLLSGLLKIF